MEEKSTDGKVILFLYMKSKAKIQIYFMLVKCSR